jgi:hypothetical protein
MKRPRVLLGMSRSGLRTDDGLGGCVFIIDIPGCMIQRRKYDPKTTIKLSSKLMLEFQLRHQRYVEVIVILARHHRSLKEVSRWNGIS